MRQLFIFLVVFLKYTDAQGRMFPADPKLSPENPPNVTMTDGDIGLTPEEVEMEKLAKEGKIEFSAIMGKNLRWKDGIIPYVIDCSLENLPESVKSVKAAIAQWEQKTCIRFVKWTNQKYHLTFFRHSHCWGHVGQVDNAYISVGRNCDFENVMVHEIGHSVGLYHEQNRDDRDQFVNVLWENIGSFKSAFAIIPNTNSYGVPYDYKSIMHYPWTAFSINGKPTMEPKFDTKGKVPYIGLSEDDVILVSRMYDCPAIEARRGRRRRRRRVKRAANKFDRLDCVDRHSSCEYWAKQGECKTNPDVSRTCKMSCGAETCFGGDCKDNYKDCPVWKKWGHCKFVQSVQSECQKSCSPHCKAKGKPPKAKTPAPVVADCKDKNKLCPTWKKWGHCKIKNGYVPLNCKKSCDLCSGKAKPPPTPTPTPAPTPAPTPEPETRIIGNLGNWNSWPNRNYLGTGTLCVDKDRDCKKWAAKGECGRNPGWMLRNCMMSCTKTRCDRTTLRPPGTCNEPLGIGIDFKGKSKIPDSAMTATSTFDPGGGWTGEARNARLYFEDEYNSRRVGAWCGDYTKTNGEQHVDVDLGRTRKISYIATQGRPAFFERVSKFSIHYSHDGVTYTPFTENRKEKKFFGNCDHSTPVLNKFEGYIQARYIRYIPWEWNFPCVRMELYGC